MKTLKKVILTLSLLLFAFVFVKAELPNRSDAKATDVLTKYIESTTTGQKHDFNKILSDDFKQYIDCEKMVLNQNKKQFLKHLKLLENLIFNCTTDYLFVEEKDDFVIAKVDIQFPTFIKTDYVTMNNTDKGWRITNISVHYH